VLTNPTVGPAPTRTGDAVRDALTLGMSAVE